MDLRPIVFSTVIKSALTRLNDFFFGRDNTCWDLVRIGAAITVLLPLVLLGISGNYERLYGHWGMLPRNQAVDVVYWPGFLFLMKADPNWIWKIYWATMVAALCLGFGLGTRIAAATTFCLSVATVQRNLISFNGEHGILAFVLIGLVFAPAPQCWSIDHLLLKKPLPSRAESWPARFVQFNVCLMYFFTTVGKLLGSWKPGSSEIWYQITLSDWFRFPEVEWFRTPWLSWLAVHSSLLLEGSFAFLVWTRLRFPLVLLLIAFHLVIAILFSNGVLFFNIAAIVALCGFLKTTDFRRREKPRVTFAGQIIESARR
jgi:Vitamin K-dependent gamma-carboxylase